MQDSTQDQLNISVQLASSSDAERIFRVMNDISHGCSGGMCLQFQPPFALHLPVPLASAALLVCYSAVPWSYCRDQLLAFVQRARSLFHKAGRRRIPYELINFQLLDLLCVCALRVCS